MTCRCHARCAAILAALILTLFAHAVSAAEHKTIDIFVNGKLAEGIEIENARVEDGRIVTAPLGVNGFGNPSFIVKGLNIDISEMDIAQVSFRLIVEGSRDNRPNYSEILVDNTAGKKLYISWFPFRAWDTKDPNYMTKSFEYDEVYGPNRRGKNFGSITGFQVQVNVPPSGIVMYFREIQILIAKSLDDRFPPDRVPDPNWEKGSIANVYAISPSDRVYLDETDSPLEKENTVWKDGRVLVSGARNETVAFQVIIEAAAGSDGLNDVDVRFAGVSKGDARIDNSAAQEPDNIYNYVGRHIQLYRARYVLYDRPSSSGGGFAEMLGKRIPDILIPFEAKWGGAPFSIFPGETQSVWIDTYIRADAVAGLYKGNVEVLVKGKVVRTLPVELTVHDFSLPNEPSVHSLMWGEVTTKHGATGDAYRELEKTYRRFFRRNYTEMFKGIPSEVTDEQLADEKEWALRSGDLFTRENGYEGPGYGLPAPIIFITMYGGGMKPFGGPGDCGDEESWHAGLKKYKKMIDKYAPGAMFVYYATDEPNHAWHGGIEAFKSWMNTVAPWVHSFNDKYDAHVKIFVTIGRDVARDIPDLDMYAGDTLAEVDQIEKDGDINCRWNGPQGIGHYASALRVCGWQAYHLRAKIWWMWAWNYYTSGMNVYQNPYNFTNAYGELGAGVGMFVYPGKDVFFPEQNPGLDGPVPSARFFNWRQGFVDYEYLALAAKVDPKAVAEIVEPLVSGAVLDSGLPGEQASAGYPIGDTHYAAAREKLVEIILRGRENRE